MAQALRRGRPFPNTRLWGLVEEKLVGALTQLWADVFAHPQEDLEMMIHRRLDPVAQRLNRTLASQ